MSTTPREYFTLKASKFQQALITGHAVLSGSTGSVISSGGPHVRSIVQQTTAGVANGQYVVNFGISGSASTVANETFTGMKVAFINLEQSGSRGSMNGIRPVVVFTSASAGTFGFNLTVSGTNGPTTLVLGAGDTNVSASFGAYVTRASVPNAG